MLLTVILYSLGRTLCIMPRTLDLILLTAGNHLIILSMEETSEFALKGSGVVKRWKIRRWMRLEAGQLCNNPGTN